MKFTKMQACGNDYIYVDCFEEKIKDPQKFAVAVSDRHFGIGADGMVLICPSDKADFRMRIFNADGSEAEMCGNAIRSVGKYVYEHGLSEKTELEIETLSGIKHLSLTIEEGLVENIKADIGVPVLDTKKIPVCTDLPEFLERPVAVIDRKFYFTAVSMGNPHCIAYVEDAQDIDVEKYGRAIEYMTELFPNRTNVSFAEYIRKDYIKMREWERGAGQTLGCGTGCAATVVAGVLTGRTSRKVTVEQPGGLLQIEWDEESGHIFMTGPAQTVFEGETDPAKIMGSV